MKITMYVLCVLKFEDGTIVFGHDELTRINVAIGADLQDKYLLAGGEQNGESSDGFKVYRLDSNRVQNLVGESAKIKSAEIGYYHHRVIVEFILDSAGDFSELREIRALLKKWADEMIKRCVKEKINKLVYSSQIKNKDAKVECYYTYPLIVLKRRRKSSKTFPFSEETGSSCFDIVEPAFWYRSGKKHMMRVSIPSAILYHAGRRIGENVLRDIVNAIYQYCLYEQKSNTGKPYKNVLNEKLLATFWEQIFNRLGSRTIDIHISRLTFAMYVLAILAIIIPLILWIFR